jgi:hypothetical protein
MSYTHKQKLFADFMLKRIGMTNEHHINNYTSHLETLYGKMDYYPIEHYIGGEKFVRKKWFWSVSQCIEVLKEEIELKKDVSAIQLKNVKKRFSPTDLADYVFCPVSFTIKQSFLIEKPSGLVSTKTGIMFHEQLRLIPSTSIPNKTEATLYVDNLIFSNKILQWIKKCKNVFCGHIESNNPFINGLFSGIPDYIFQDEEGKYFVVEEKFHKKRDPNKLSQDEKINYYGLGADDSFVDEDAERDRINWKTSTPKFFANHLIQVIAYIKNILPYNIEYGYLIYWFYDFNGEEPYIHKVSGKKVILDQQNEQLYDDTLKSIIHLRREGNIPFSSNDLNMNKCGGCIVNKYCGHKTGKYQNIEFPYNKNHMKLYQTSFPEELKKEQKDKK